MSASFSRGLRPPGVYQPQQAYDCPGALSLCGQCLSTAGKAYVQQGLYMDGGVAASHTPAGYACMLISSFNPVQAAVGRCRHHQAVGERAFREGCAAAARASKRGGQGLEAASCKKLLHAGGSSAVLASRMTAGTRLKHCWHLLHA
jgi:hypothetical protein